MKLIIKIFVIPLGFWLIPEEVYVPTLTINSTVETGFVVQSKIRPLILSFPDWLLYQTTRNLSVDSDAATFIYYKLILKIKQFIHMNEIYNLIESNNTV